MAPARTRTANYATPSWCDKGNLRSATKPSSTSRAKSTDRLAGRNYLSETVGVYLRLRPLKLNEPSLLKIDDQQVQTNPPDGSEPQIFKFTRVFDNSPQSEIFDKVARPVAQKFITEAKDGLIFTYGITGSGKTYTMEGLRSDPGLINRTFDFIFNSIGSHQTKKNVIKHDGQNSYIIDDQEQLYPYLAPPETMSTKPSVIKLRNRTKETASVITDPTAYYCLFISLIELYRKEVHDLFEDLDPNYADRNKKKPEIRNDKRTRPYVANAVEIEVKSADEAVEFYTTGIKRRRTGSTALNSESSRGHCVLNLKLVQVRKLYDDKFDKNTLLSSQLCLVDLAGSERTKRSGTTGVALHEACSINNSLGALRKCIRALRDKEPTNNIPYRDYSLTRLFKSYFEGHGSVCMVLCVKPSAEDFHENSIAMEFGLLTQDVATDYASPPKQIKRSRNRDSDLNMMYEYFDRKISLCVPNQDLNDEQYIETCNKILKSNRERRRKMIDTLFRVQNEFRQNLLNASEENSSLRQLRERMAKDIKTKDLKTEYLAKAVQLLSAAPSAPEMEPLQSSSPVDFPNPSSSETFDSNQTPAPTANSSTDAIETQNHAPTNGVPILNPRHSRSLSCSSIKWVHHEPLGTIKLGTLMNPVFRKGRPVKNLKSSDILGKSASAYSVVHQVADTNGDVETSIHKADIIPTVCGGAQVIFNDIETMRQVSPKRRKRAASDAHYTH